MSLSAAARALSRLPFSSSVTPLQALTYLLCVCLFSISFLVFLNSSISFVITDLLGIDKGVGDFVGTLGFVDELVALVACPIWGVLSDRLGVRTVVCLGYGIVGVSLFVFVQAKNVYPQLLFARIFFSIGGAATATMVTAFVPLLTASQHERLSDSRCQPNGTVDGRSANGESRLSISASISSELTITPATFSRRARARSARRRSRLNNVRDGDGTGAPDAKLSSTPPRLAGLVGVFTGCGALVALGVFLPLPARFSKVPGISAGQAVVDSYYVVGTVAFAVAAFSFFGLRNLAGEEGRGWRAMLGKTGFVKNDDLNSQVGGDPDTQSSGRLETPYWKSLWESVALGFGNFNIGLGYLGGFVARASSVGISLFIPLYVNAYFISSGLCEGDPTGRTEDMKRECRRAYVLAAELTGASQLVALLFAPIFGYLSDRYRRFNIPLLVSAFVGVVGYIGFALLESPEPSSKNGEGGSPFVFVLVALLGISQIGAIVCSLGLLGRGVLGDQGGYIMSSQLDAPSADDIVPDQTPAETTNSYGTTDDQRPDNGVEPDFSTSDQQPQQDIPESASLLGKKSTNAPKSHSHLKGSIAGVYSLAGGAGILLLTKLGGYLFDSLSKGAPFYMLAAFNGVLLLIGVLCSVMEETFRRRRW
ncbi:MAG: hypothetical protein M1839_009191 [Geoglossum umbratile]|nr:MAG: hypothetical protein M1839_009191 [Geoglossum umbratile]